MRTTMTPGHDFEKALREFDGERLERGRFVYFGAPSDQPSEQVKGAQRLAKEKYALRVTASPRRGDTFSLVNTGTGLVTDVPTGDIKRLIVNVVGAEKFDAGEEVPEGATEFYLTESFPG